ncbi:MAG TPA: HU family DNA-binding protein [Ignavibacteriaceae bacterium]
MKHSTGKGFGDYHLFNRIFSIYFNLTQPLPGAVCSRSGVIIIYKKKFCWYRKAAKFVARLNSLKNYTMNKAELIAKLADDAGITKTQSNAALDSFVEAVTKTLKGGGKVTLVGFGTFSVSKRAARNGRNPQTGAVIKIKAKKVARFKAGKELAAKL